MSLQQELTKLNIDIGEAEKQRDKDTLNRILANDVIFRRASGVVVDKATYLKDLQNSENTYNYLCSEVIEVKLSESQDTAIVTLHVRAKGKRGGNPFEGVYRNIRAFRKEGQDWKCYAWFNEPLEPLSKNDAYTLYESGKKRRYELLFAVNFGAFVIAKLLTSEGDKLLPSFDYKVLGSLSLLHLAIGMILFTALMCFDIFKFGENMRDRYLKGEVFGPPGQFVLISLGILICLGWLFAAVDFSAIFSKQSTALLFPIGFLGIFRLFPNQFSFR
jgi:ketosteroid isomerase-like protein